MESDRTSNRQTRRRPKLFLALGKNEPPLRIQVEGREYTHQRTFKHDSWAATAIYIHGQHRIVCKFNRTEPVLLLPAGWLGRWLARRESAMYRRLADLPNIAAGYGEVFAEGRRLKHVSAHDYIEGHPLGWHDRVRDDFFVQLRDTLLELHRRGIAYVDMNKWENIIVDQAGNPCLIDFQISVRLPRVWPLSSVLKILQHGDLYHLSKHAARIRPDLYNPEQFVRRPLWIRMHRKIANPFRAFRRRLLVLAGVRKGKGKPQSEHFVEEGLRETGAGGSAIERLYGLLRSKRYLDYASGSGRNFVDVAFVDLCNRAPANQLEENLVANLKNQTPHDQVIWLLKSPVFFSNSQGWSGPLIEQKIRTIEAKLLGLEKSKRAAA